MWCPGAGVVLDLLIPDLCLLPYFVTVIVLLLFLTEPRVCLQFTRVFFLIILTYYLKELLESLILVIKNF